MVKIFSCFFCIFLISCASGPTKQEPDSYSKDSVLELAEQSYIRGCIEGQNLIEKKLTKGVRLKRCQELSKFHKADLIKLLK